ncbi:MAG: alpha/beta hydrolase [Mediterranea massiliensis]|nr:alpha/beta hydrolase [Mediterranea massiliensis]
MKRTFFLLLFTLIGVTSLLATPIAISNSQEEVVSGEYKKIAITSDIPYRQGDSKSWLLDVAEPVNFGTSGLRPAIVIVHGGGWRAGSKHHPVYRDLLVDYALQGYVTVSVGYRFDQEAAFPACIEDVKCAVRWLKAHAKELRVDPNRIGTYGHSAGGHLSLMLGVSSDNEQLEGDGPWKEYSSSVACSVGGAPPTEIGNPQNLWAKHPEWWPIGYIKGNHIPLLLLQGKDDPVVKPHLTNDYVDKMRKAGSNVDYIEIPGHHGVAYDLGLEITKPAMDAFFAKHLKNENPKQQILKIKAPEGGGTGRFRAIAVTEKSLPGFVVYRPANLLAATPRNAKLPVMVYANGGCMDTSIHQEKMLIEIASHGYVVIAIGEMQNYPFDRKEKSTPSSMLVEAIDWIIAKSTDKESEYYNLIDTNHISAAGHSCGGAQVLAVADDTRIKSYLLLNSGMGKMEMAGASRKSLKKLHAPIIYMIGGKGDVAYENAQMDYKAIKKVPVVFADMAEAGHTATFAQPYGGAFAQMVIRWLDWQAKGKDENASLFLEANLKDFPGWTMESKNFK